jgi:hypothetical protein
MAEKWDEESESAPEGNPWQFSVGTLMTVVTLAAVICGFVVWLGLGTVVLITANAVGTFVGLVVCSYMDMSFAFDDLKSDVIKCFVIAAAVVLPAFIIRYISFNYDVFLIARSYAIVVCLIYVFGVKLAWLQLEKVEMLIICLSALFFTFVGANLAWQLL